MQFYECISICAVVAAVTGVLPQTLYDKARVRPFALCYAGILILALGRFSIVPVAEFRCNMAALCLPLYFLAHFAGACQARASSKPFWRSMFFCAALPIVWVLAISVAAAFQEAYISVDLTGPSLLNAQAALCAGTYLCITLLHSLRKKRRLA